ncbi:MAG: hypothetical protein OXI64_04080, partial [Defluviicoccus sp.]|nr:hypothetical protein [Defluviicoccus sp.]
HAAQGMTRDAAIAVLDTGHGELGGQAALYVEASRARDRFVLVTDNRETLAEALEENDGAGMTAREAVGEDDDPPPDPPAAAVGMLREMRDDWRALAAKAEAENVELNRMDDYARIVTGVVALAQGTDLPADLAAFAAEVRNRDAEIAARRYEEIAFVQKADMHCRNRPLLHWAAGARGMPVSDLPEHAAWRAEGEALAETGRALQERRGIAGRVAAALARIARTFRLDAAKRFREEVVRHEAEAHAAGVDPRVMAGAERLAERAASLDADGLPEDIRRPVAAWTTDVGRAAVEEARRETPEHPQHEEAGRRIAGFLHDCRDHLGQAAGIGPAQAGASADAALDGWLERAETLRMDGLRMLGEGAGARLDDPARIRLAGAAEERDRVRDAVDALAERALGLRAEAFMQAHRDVESEAREAGRDPADLPAWDALRTRAEGLRDESGLAAAARDAARSVLAHDVRVEIDTAPVAAFIEAGIGHLDRRAGIDREKDRSAQSEPDSLSAWREDSADLRETGRRLLGQSPPDRSPGQAPDPSPGQAGDAAETRAASRLEHMPRLRERVGVLLDRLEAVELQDVTAAFREAATSVEARAREQDTLPLHAEGYSHATEMARALTDRQALPASVRPEAGAWLDRDRAWREELATARELTGQEGRQADPARRREAALLPAVADAVRLETDRLARLPPLERGIAWTGDAPLIAGDRIAFRADGRVLQAVVDSPGASCGVRESDTLRLRMADPGAGMTPAGGRPVEVGARTLAESGCVRAAWSDAGLRELELARQRSVPLDACRTPCPEPVPGDRIAWTEAAGPRGEVRTIEAEVRTRTDTADSYALDLRVIRATGPGAPEPGSTIGRSADAVTARGCFRAPWADEARRERVLHSLEQERESRQQEENRQQGQDRSKDRGFSM